MRKALAEQNLQAGACTRLSREDDNLGESGSIVMPACYEIGFIDNLSKIKLIYNICNLKIEVT
jgi:hypothetical protein